MNKFFSHRKKRQTAGFLSIFAIKKDFEDVSEAYFCNGSRYLLGYVKIFHKISFVFHTIQVVLKLILSVQTLLFL